MPAIALAFVAAKAGCFVVGSLIHEANELLKHFGVDHDDTARASCLQIKDEQLGLQATPNESPSNALIRYASREVVLSSSSRALAILRNDALALETPFNVFEKDPLSIMKSFNFFAAWAWFRTRFIVLMQSTLRSVITNMKRTVSSFIGSVSESESIVEKKVVASTAFLVQANSSRLMTQAVLILKEATHLIKSHCERNMFTLLGHILPGKVGGKDRCFDLLPDSNSIGDIISVDFGTWMQKYLTMVITCVRRVLTIFLNYSTTNKLLRPLRLHGLKAMALVLLFFSISIIVWSIPLLIFEGCKPEQGSLQKPHVLEPISELEAGVFKFTRPQLLANHSDGTSNAFNLMESIGNFDDLYSVSMATGANDDDGQVDFTPSPHLRPAKDFITTTTSTLAFQTDFIWGDEATAVSLVDWNINDYHHVQSKSGCTVVFGSALESSLFTYVLESVHGVVHASNKITSEHFDGYNLSAIADKAFVLGFNSGAFQDMSSTKLDLGYFSSSTAFDGVPSTTPTMIFIEAGPPQELSTINFLSREFDDGCTGPMHVDDRCFDFTGLRAHETHTGLVHPGLIMLLWSQNDCIAASLSHRQTGYFSNHKVVVGLPLGWNIEVSHCIQSEPTPFIFVLGDLSSDRFDTGKFAMVVAEVCDDSTAFAIADEKLTFTSSFVAQAPQNQSYVEILGRSILLTKRSDRNTLTMQMIVAELGVSDEISPIQCRKFDGSSASDAALTHPLLRPQAQVGSLKRFSTGAQPSLRYGVVEESTSLDIFHEFRQLAWILLTLAYRNSDGATNEPCDDALSTESEMSSGANLDLEQLCDDELIFADEDEENGPDEAIMRNANTKPSRHEVIALRSGLGRHWKSPSTSKRRMRRSSRYRSRPKYFEPTWA